MNRVKTAMYALILLPGLLAGSAVQAHGRGSFHSHSRVGVFIGIPLGAPWYYPPYRYYSYPVVAASVAPPVYIEQGQPPSSQQEYWWYYCPNPPQGYYPYIRQCATAWQKVAPQPPGQLP